MPKNTFRHFYVCFVSFSTRGGLVSDVLEIALRWNSFAAFLNSKINKLIELEG